ncbi:MULTISPECIES: alpha-glucan family phosphorylase [unclassified Modestobacter]|uniref:alpha-glucan family phosphorylase n=1 Tax=unclassified Modestobacter TaxID=2643866 RepID=UPI0022AA2357|nr:MULTISPECIES: alpha-glucan family phosphorylase [unclassified Modestobacter]MCZ2823996.1 alpha-glucan family phosphorylase [Modestobacter sp. VKM Ac-2981]MCZ2852241.1 alpha-glucan family phosphorylase [Modestobacter sp. VKM Ac-2982]
MRALRRLTVRASLPEALMPLSQLVTNLRWSWHPETRDLFEALDPELWTSCGGDPVRVLGEVSAERLAALADDPGFLAQLTTVAADLREYLDAPHWYQSLGADAPATIAYFSAEFGITEVLPQYSGGLGILAGDHLKAASDLGVPLIGVGLLYRSGYFSQGLSADGWQLEHYPALDPHGLPLKLVRDADRNAVVIAVPLPEGRTLYAHVYRAQVGRVSLLLLDSDIEENSPAERGVTDRLYGGGEDHRLRQEMLLGIGGVRALRAFCSLTGTPPPEVFHANEGHAGFQGIERIRELTESHGLSFTEALQAVRGGTVFTTHTPVPAGIDRFPKSLIERYFAGFGVPVDQLLTLGQEPDPGTFNMAHMGLRLGQRANGVSQLHGHVSRDMFGPLWPGFDPDDVPIGSITNGVHAPTWTARELVELGTQTTSQGDPLEVDGEVHFDGVDRIPAAELWRTRRLLRGRLVEEVRRRVRATALSRGAAEAELDWTETAFDPDVLTIGFARRVPSYKRLTLMLRDPDRLKALLLDEERPVQLVIAGKSHPADDGGKQLIQQMVKFADDPEIRHRIAFLPNYDIGMARHLYWGCDVWLNNPLRPLEACGTSGMKSALNGGLNLSIRDGWWDEWFDGQNGWAIPTADGVEDPERRDDVEAQAIYDLLHRQVVPRFYEVDADGLPTRWVEMVRDTLRETGPKVLATRMVRDYVQRLYVPAAGAARSMAAGGYEAARAEAAWRAKLLEHWSGVRVAHVEATGVGETPEIGGGIDLRAEVELPGLAPSDVLVEAAYGRVDDADGLHEVTTLALRHESADGSRHWFTGTVPLKRTGAFGYTVRVLPHSAHLVVPAELGVVVNA